jgi:hypothetical protein
MAFMKALKNLGIIEDDQPKTKEPSHVPPKTQPISAATDPTEGQAPMSDNTPSLLDMQAVEQGIDQAIQNSPAFKPVTTFLTVADSMKSVIGEEGTRLKAAAAASGVDVVTLNTAADSYADVLMAESKRFDEQFVAKAEESRSLLNDRATELQARIDGLTAELGQLSDQKNELRQQIRDADDGLEKAKIDFRSVVNKLADRYNEIANKIKQHVGTGVANG